MTTTGQTIPTTGLAIQQIRQISINVHDPDRAVAFYRDILGLQLLFRAGHLAFFDCGGIRLMLSPPEKPNSITRPRFSISKWMISRTLTRSCKRAT